jgi:tRNA pseudouridine38-40 synthase
MPVFRIDLGYDGGGFRGYAAQERVRTVQGELERALAIALSRREPPATSVAGRTDAGVHARGQVASFASTEAVDLPKLVKSLNTMLGPEVVVYDVAEAASDFDARLSARWRRYRYRVLNADRHDPLRRHVTYWYPAPLDIGLMNRGSGHLVGERDFASLCRAKEGHTTMRSLHAARWWREGDEVVLEVTGSAFCHQMVRSIVALCLDIGRGRVDADSVPAILAARDRNAARGAAPPHGLILWEVGYERLEGGADP